MSITKVKIRAVENVTTKKDGQPFAPNKYTGLAQMIQRVTYTGEDGITRTANCFSPIEQPVFSVGDPEDERTVVVTQTQRGEIVYNNIRPATEKDLANTVPNSIPQPTQPDQPHVRETIAEASRAPENQEVKEISKCIDLVMKAQVSAVTAQIESLSLLGALNLKVDALVSFIMSIATTNSHLVKGLSIEKQIEKIEAAMKKINEDHIENTKNLGEAKESEYVKEMYEKVGFGEKENGGEADIETPDQHGAEENQTAVDNGDKDPFSDG